jgi:hypothetical protein
VNCFQTNAAIKDNIMHHKNILKKAVVLALSLICTRGVAMELMMEYKKMLSYQPRSCLVDFRITYTHPETDSRVATIIPFVRIKEHKNMINYLINKGMDKGAAQDTLLPWHHHVEAFYLDSDPHDLAKSKFNDKKMTEMIFEHCDRTIPLLHITLTPYDPVMELTK